MADEKPGPSTQTIHNCGNTLVGIFNFTHQESKTTTTKQQTTLSNNLFLNSIIQTNQTNCKDKTKEQEVIKNLKFEVPGLPKFIIVGREEDAEMVETLMRRNDLKLQRRVAICGMGGLGKTTFAINCVKVWNEKQDSGRIIPLGSNVAFIDGDNRMNFEASVKRLARKLKINEEQMISEVLKDIVNLYKDANLQLLIIADNIDNLDDTADLLELDQDNLYILATSQNIEIDVHFNIYKLKLLSEQEGLDLILSILDHNLQNDDVPTRNEFIKTFQELYTYTEGLPITISHAGAWISQSMLKKQRIKRMERSTEFYLKLLQQYLATFKDELQKDFPEQFKTRITKSAFLSLKLNIDKLSCVESKKFILMLGYLNPDAICVDMFHSLFVDDTLETVLDETSKYFLISVNLKFTDWKKEIRIHRLVQEVAKIHLNAFETSLGPLVLQVSCRFDLLLHLNFINEHNDHYSNSSRFMNLCSKDDLVSTINKIFEKNIFLRLGIQLGRLKKAGCNIANYTNWYLPHKLIVLLKIQYEIIYNPILSMLLQFFKDEFCSPVEDGITLQHLAVLNDSVGPGIISFIHRYVDVNRCTSSGVSPLHVAAVVYAKDVLQLIVSLGVDVNVCDFNGNTPLHSASRWNVRPDCVDVLLSMDNVQVNAVNKYGHCPLYLALLEENCKEIPLSLLKAGAKYDFTYDNSDTVLHRLAKLNYSEAVNFLLLQPDVQLDVQNKNGETPLYLAVTRKRKKFVREERIPVSPLEAGVNYDLLYLHVTNERLEWEDTALNLLKAGARYDFKLKNGDNLLHFASRLCFDQVVDFICQNLQSNDFLGINDVTYDGNSSVHLAVLGNRFLTDDSVNLKFISKEDIVNTITHLVKAGANLQLRNKAGETPLDIVLRRRNESDDGSSKICFDLFIDFIENLSVTQVNCEDNSITGR